MTNYQNLLFNKVNNELDPQAYSSFGKVTTDGIEIVPILSALTALLIQTLYVWLVLFFFVVLLKRWHKYSQELDAKQFPLLHLTRKSTWKPPRKPPQKPTRKPPCTNDPKEAPSIIYVPPKEDKLQLWVKPCTALVVTIPVRFKTREHP